MKQLIKITFFVLTVTGVTEIQAQYKLTINNIQIKSEEMEKFEPFADKIANMTSDLPVSIALFKNQDLIYYTCFHLVERGKKFKLVNHDFVVYNGDRYKGERQVLKYKKTEGVRGRITGISQQQITFDKDLNRMIQMVYRFELVLD